MSNTVKKDAILEIYVDGASRGNPGPAAWAYIFIKNGKIIEKKNGYIGKNTNNTAEYNAIINALKDANDFSKYVLKVYSDSQLVVRQINKVYRINKQHLSKLCNEVYNLRKKYPEVDFLHVKRNNPFIQKCDSLCNKCLDEKGF
ncbi:MAG: ribonuclease HI family protein [Candidatus Lokiarchaeota archaeon]|nr:ribonuclease HI family protein [Candidatus Lokiarchaeota archaeon]